MEKNKVKEKTSKEVEVMEKTLSKQETALQSNPFNTKALANLIKERKNLIVKINDVYEISRPLALELLKLVREQALSLNGELHEKFNLLHADKEQVIMECSITVKFKIGNEEKSFTVSDIGDAYASEKGKDTVLARVAATRALKRVLERLVGEDFINQVIMSLPEVQNQRNNPATENQKKWLRKLKQEGKIGDVDIDNLSKDEASKILSNFFKK